MNLVGNRDYIIRICAGTKSKYNPNKTLLGEASEAVKIFLPERNCQEDTNPWPSQGELSAGMIVGAVCAVLFLILAIIGFVIWR